MVPVVKVFLVCLYQLKLLLRIVNQCAQLTLLAFAQCRTEKVVDLSLDVSRCVLYHMLEGFILSVYVGKEVFRAFREVKYCLKVDNLRTGVCNGRERVGEQLQVSHVLFNVFGGSHCSKYF